MTCPVVEKISLVEQSQWIDYLNSQRWFSGKSREIDGVEILAQGVVSDELPCCVLVLIEVKYKEGAPEVYLLPLTYTDGPAAVKLSEQALLWRESPLAGTAGTQGAAIYDDLTAESCCRALYDIIDNHLSISDAAGNGGESASDVETSSHKAVGEFVGTQSKRYESLIGTVEERQPVTAINYDQSNSAIRFGERLFLKLFRKLETGVNPDYEIAQFLTDRTSFGRLPQVAGAIEYHTSAGEVMTLAVLQTWVPNQGNAWEAMLADLKRVLAGGDFHEDDLIRLGQRTAEMHNALASCMDLAEFAPEAMTSHDIDRLVARLQHRAKKILTSVEELLQSDSTKSKAVNRDKLTQLLKLAPAIDEVAERIKNSPLAAKTRVHGDYHLGQVLCQDHDFIILDFEGEPARPLGERCAKDCPLRDVAGMIRSFSYAAHVGLLDYAKPQAPAPEQQQRAVEWRRKCEEFFWRSYLQTAANAIFLPADEQATRTLLDFYIVEKALYELGYEVNNRPDWVEIPLDGILELLSPKANH